MNSKKRERAIQVWKSSPSSRRSMRDPDPFTLRQADTICEDLAQVQESDLQSAMSPKDPMLIYSIREMQPIWLPTLPHPPALACQTIVQFHIQSGLLPENCG